jgi:hypothetical protein
MLVEQHQTVSMRGTIPEQAHIMLVNTPCSHLQSYYAPAVSSVLATSVSFTGVSWDDVGESVTRCRSNFFLAIVRFKLYKR